MKPAEVRELSTDELQGREQELHRDSRHQRNEERLEGIVHPG